MREFGAICVEFYPDLRNQEKKNLIFAAFFP